MNFNLCIRVLDSLIKVSMTIYHKKYTDNYFRFDLKNSIQVFLKTSLENWHNRFYTIGLQKLFPLQKFL